MEELWAQFAAIKARQQAPPPPQARHVQNMGYGSDMGYANYMEPPPQQWGHTYHPYDRNHHNLSWTNPIGGTYAPGYLPQPRQEQNWHYPSTDTYAHGQRTQPPYQAPRVEPPPQQAPRLKSMAELYKEEYGYDYVPPTDEERMQRSGKIYQNHSHWHSGLIRSYSDVEAYVPAPPPPQKYQAPRVEPPQQEPSLWALLIKLQEEMDVLATEIDELKVKTAEHAEKIEADASLMPMLPNETQSPREQEKAITMEPPPPSHERAEATKATEEEMSEEIPVPTVYPPSTDTVGRSEEKQWPMEQWQAHVPSPLYVESAQECHVDACSMGESDKLIEQVVHEIELLCGEKKAQLLGVRQERKAAMRKKPEGSKSGPRGRYKSRHAKMKGSRATSRKIKPSTPRNTTKVKMKEKRGEEDNMAPRIGRKMRSSGRCVPKMEYLKFIGGKHLFPPPFIP